ncbi:MAG: energy transducer TonB [Parahaliea sp.]
MNDNLARKPRLTPAKAGGRRAPDIAAIAPELHDQPPAKERDTLRWLSSLLTVLMVYGAPLLWWLMPERQPGANTPPPAAMVVELAPVPVAPASPPEMPPGPEQAEATPQPEPEPKPPPEPEAQEPDILPAPPEVKPEVAVRPAPEPRPDREPLPEEPPPPEPPDDTPPVEEELQSIASAPPEAPVEDLEAAAPHQGVSVPVINANAIPTWQNRLMLKLNEAKRYPIRARRQRQEGVTYLRFTMDREGRVVAKSIAQSAGYSLLDDETLALLDRAQPLPEPPPELAGKQLEFVVPVEFFLNR